MLKHCCKTRETLPWLSKCTALTCLMARMTTPSQMSKECRTSQMRHQELLKQMCPILWMCPRIKYQSAMAPMLMKPSISEVTAMVSTNWINGISSQSMALNRTQYWLITRTRVQALARNKNLALVPRMPPNSLTYRNRQTRAISSPLKINTTINFKASNVAWTV